MNLEQLKFCFPRQTSGQEALQIYPLCLVASFALLPITTVMAEAPFLIDCVTFKNELNCDKHWQLNKIMCMVFPFHLLRCASFPVFDMILTSIVKISIAF
jgi:hypothetical protein